MAFHKAEWNNHIMDLYEKVLLELDDYWVKGPNGLAIDVQSTPKLVRKELKRLVLHGFARFTYASREDDDSLAGSGYIVTSAGILARRELW